MKLVIDAFVELFAFLMVSLGLLLCQVICTLPHMVLDTVLAVGLQDKPIVNIVAISLRHRQLACVVVVMTFVVVVVVVVVAFVMVMVAFVVVVVVAFVVVVVAFVVVMAAVVMAMVNYGFCIDVLSWRQTA